MTVIRNLGFFIAWLIGLAGLCASAAVAEGRRAVMDSDLGAPGRPYVLDAAPLSIQGSFRTERIAWIAGAATVDVAPGVWFESAGELGSDAVFYAPLRKQGGGQWIISAPNRVWGPLQLLEGGLSLRHPQAVGPNSHLDVMAGARLEYASGLLADFPVQGHARSGQPAIDWHVAQGEATQRGPVFGNAVWMKSGQGLLWLDQRQGGSLNGRFLVRQGALGLRGDVPAHVQVADGAVLRAQDALVRALAVLPGGSLHLGSPGRPLRVLEDLRLDSGSVLRMRVLGDGRFDQLHVQGKSLLAGALWVELASSGLDGDYRIVQADGGLAGRFESLHLDRDAALAGLDYDPQGVTLRLRPLGIEGGPAVPRVWLRHPLNVWRAQLIQDAGYAMQAWRDTSHKPASGGAWASYRHAGQQGLQAAGMELDRQLDQLIMGVERPWRRGRLGGMAVYQTSRLRDAVEAVRSDTRSYYVGVYGQQPWHGLETRLTLMAGRHLVRHAWPHRQGRGRADSVQLLLGAAYPIWRQGEHAWSVEVDWRAMRIRQSGLELEARERWQAGAQRNHALDSRLLLTWRFDDEDSQAVSWRAWLGWERQWNRPAATHDWQVNGLPAGDAAPYRSARHAWLMGLRMQAPLSDSSWLTLSYQARRSGHLQDHGFELQGRWLF
ncbi:MAG: autotransporter domain-containing protein [Alcaligenes sp.]